ncbi:MAG TPA: HAD hydrolase-like protein, partial [Candidatus Sulfotelmatobacter sp.]|nr:HAD hydrolase-like protein [Candidatus Sulfotelmatobacter sp.]
DGVIDLLTSLKAKDAVLGLLSGNVEGIAWAKLQRAEIKKYFDFGAFGDNAYKRVDLVKIAKENARIILRKDFEIKDFVIVGDTPKDIQCAKEAKIKSIAVATGIYTFEDLKKEKPDLLIHNFASEGKKVVNFLNN